MTAPSACQWALTTRSPDETQALGRLLGEASEPDSLVLLTGELGAGKTCFSQGVAAGLGVQEQVTSPTFILAAEYQGRLPLYHLDLYRIEAPEEAADLDLDRFLGGRAVTLVEWAERALGLWPEDHLTIVFSHRLGEERDLMIKAGGPRSRSLLQGLRRRWTSLP